jgi:hypothetical protein
MKKMNFATAYFVAVTCVSPLMAQNAPVAAAKPVAAPKMQTNERLKALQMASDMAQYGIAKKQPMLLVSAAQILIENPVGNLKVEKEEQSKDADAKPNAADKTTKSAQTVAFTSKDLLAKAQEMAKGDATVLAAIQKTEASKAPEVAFGGAISGSVHTTRRVDGYSRYSFTCTYVGGRLAEMYLKGDGDSDLDYYLYDSYGNLVDSDEDSTDSAIFRWYPNSTMTYRVVVRNRGGTYNVFQILTN